ncbi:hypothetical protein WICMUC_002694 [Wickerhamomyces mucosus]|uniref:Rrp15p-domain-containing protein n=1 Tax=Wickerhamomyces mucosus TaxID=1378264 RepID=A0A9P8PNQ7_9ASCO|nr:hypothetical protein WICMUC_002694 [Wickerhamomyces mucosus]
MLIFQDYENLSDFDDGITSDADIEYDDELDLDNVSSDDTDDQDNNAESGSEDENDDDNDENLPKLKKRKKNIDDGSESFANAVSAILGSKLKAYDRKDPILARSKQTIKKAESEKLEAKARQELLSEKKKVYDKDRVKDLLPKNNENARSILEHERKLKKIAQRGVIRLFNVIMSTQNKTNSEASKTKVLGQDQKDKLITEISKENFFDLVKQAGN